MECILLAGGKGTRLGLDIPKALVPITNETILDIRIRLLKAQGITHFILATGFKKEQVKEYIKRNYYDLNVDFAEEDSLLGTGGAIKNAMKYTKDEQVFVSNVDDITDINLKELKQFSKGQNTIVIANFNSQFGIVQTENNLVLEFKEKPLLKDLWASCGFYILNKTIPLPNIGSIEKDVFEPLAKKRELYSYKYQGSWITINTQKELEEAKKNIFNF